ncbi:MAG: glycogen-binding domain-containing protein [Gemmatimonadaceae bacterium]|nr:glycogen-binding domain-containing protein [Gemmatimonadaceae bacterium]
MGDATNGKRTIAVELPEAHQVEIMGDFTDWIPVALTRDAAGRWSTTLAIPPGAHRMNVRVDGGAWRVPPGLTPVNDDFNGLTGLLIVR